MEPPGVAGACGSFKRTSTGPVAQGGNSYCRLQSLWLRVNILVVFAPYLLGFVGSGKCQLKFGQACGICGSVRYLSLLILLLEM